MKMINLFAKNKRNKVKMFSDANEYAASQVRVPIDYMIERFPVEGKKLITAYSKHIAFVFDEYAVNVDGQYVEFMVEHNKKYEMKNLNFILASSDNTQTKAFIKGRELLEHYSVEPMVL